MKKQLFFIMMVIIPIVSRAYDAMINGYYYNLNSEEKTAVLTYYHQNYSDNAHAYTGIINIPSEITYNGEKYKVTSIDSYTFNGCRSVTSVIIPSSVTRIGDGVFNLCSNLSHIRIPSSVMEIGNRIFNESDRNILWVDIMDLAAWCNIKQNRGFNYYTPFYHLCLNGVEVKDLVIPDDITSLGNHAFSYCESLNSVTIPVSINKISDYAFADCKNLTSITIPNSVTSIEPFAFSGCEGLTSLTIPNSVTSIWGYAFVGCTGLTSLRIPNSVTSIETNAFKGCSGLTSIKVEWNRPLAGAAEAFDSDTKKNTPLYVPKGTAVMYMAAPGWSEFVNIQEYDNGADAHYITIRMGDGGVLKQSVEVGQTYTYAVRADEGWEVNTLTFDGKDMSSLLMDGQFSTPIITGNAELNVVFKEIGSSIKEMKSMTDVKVYASNSSITVTGAAENTIVAVYSINGALVTSSVGNSTFSLESGVYIVKVGSETFKVRL